MVVITEMLVLQSIFPWRCSEVFRIIFVNAVTGYSARQNELALHGNWQLALMRHQQ